MRIVLDTNVVLSALLWRGTSHHLLAAIAQRPSIQPYSRTALREELAEEHVRTIRHACNMSSRSSAESLSISAAA